LQDHPYFIGTQFHPEFKSRPLRSSAPFLGLLLAASGRLEEYLQNLPEDPLISPRLLSSENAS
jgi:CTP synthase